MTSNKSSKAMHIGLWIAQGFLALIFVWAAYAKLVQPIEETAKMLPWAKDNPALLKFTGIVEVFAAAGLILPAALRIMPRLTIYASYGVILLMIAGAIFHIARGEASLIGMNIFFLLLAAFIAWGRDKRSSILPKA